jgi:pimeloyl-ACP methyl ester carboxylesterase
VHSVSVRQAAGETRAVALVLHGGKERGHAPVTPRNLSPLRMVPFAKDLERKGSAHGLAVWQLLYAVRGWNDDLRSPVTDARAALDQVREEHGDVPVVLVGHSMGGRTAAHVLDDPSVRAMVALAPWLTDDPADGAHGKDILVAHGTRDRITSARKAFAWGDRAREAGATVTSASLTGCGHYLLRRASLWTDLTTGFALQSLGIPVDVGRDAREVLGATGASVSV